MPPGQAVGQRVPSLVETDIGQSGLLEWSCHLLCSSSAAFSMPQTLEVASKSLIGDSQRKTHMKNTACNC